MGDIALGQITLYKARPLATAGTSCKSRQGSNTAAVPALTARASCSFATSEALRQVASPLGHWLLRRPARPAICFIMLVLTGTSVLPPVQQAADTGAGRAAA